MITLFTSYFVYKVTGGDNCHLASQVSVAPIIRENASVGIFFLLCTRRIFLPVMCW